LYFYKVKQIKQNIVETNFKDYSKADLLNLIILNESGNSYSPKRRRITSIVKVADTGFRIKDDEGLFNFVNGGIKRVYDKMNMGSINQCYILSLDEATALRTEWAEKRMKNNLVKQILDINLNTATIQQLEVILKTLQS
jgi:hypothetical protein